MSNGKATEIPAAEGHQWDQDAIYLMLSDPMRRRILLSLARKGPQTAAALAPGGPRMVDCALKHLAGMRASGLVMTMPNPADGRRQLYAIAPAVCVTETATGASINFRFCQVQL